MMLTKIIESFFIISCQKGLQTSGDCNILISNLASIPDVKPSLNDLAVAGTLNTTNQPTRCENACVCFINGVYS